MISETNDMSGSLIKNLKDLNKVRQDRVLRQFMQVVTDDASTHYLDLMKEPLFVGFKVFFHFSSHYGLLASDMYRNSALAYFNRIGDDNRYALLKRFIELLSRINSNNSWMFRDLTGMSEAYSTPLDDYYKEGEFSIVMYETIDWKANFIHQIYRQIVYDSVRRVYVLPPNLRRFGMSIYVHDNRIFNSASTTAESFLRNEKNYDSIHNNTHVIFDFYGCDIKPTSGNNMYGSLSNVASGEMVTSNLDIGYKTFLIGTKNLAITGNTDINSSTLDLVRNSKQKETVLRPDISNQNRTVLDKILDSNIYKRVANNQFVQSIQDDIDSFSDIGELSRLSASNLAMRAQSLAERELNAQLGALYLGNAEGFSISRIANFFNGTSTIREIRDAYDETVNRSIRNSKQNDLEKLG